MKEGVLGDEVRLGTQVSAAFGEDRLQVVKGVEHTVSKGFVGEVTQTLGRLQLWRVGGQKE